MEVEEYSEYEDDEMDSETPNTSNYQTNRNSMVLVISVLCQEDFKIGNPNDPFWSLKSALLRNYAITLRKKR